jgi:putative tricarboxylic transport membrane protein
MAAAPQAEGGRTRPPIGELLIAFGVLALAGVMLWQTLSIPVSPLYARVGPTVIPMLASIGLGLCGAALLFEAVRGGWQEQDEKEILQDRRALALVVAGLLANIALIGPAGFTIASTILFALTSRAFGSTRLVRDAAMGFGLAIVAYLGFARALGINIGAGPPERLIEKVLSVIF